MFDNVTFAAIGAAICAGVLAYEIIGINHLGVARGIAWATFIAACALAQILLQPAYWRLMPTDPHPARW